MSIRVMSVDWCCGAEHSLPPGRHFDWDPAARSLSDGTPLLDGVYYNCCTHERVVVSHGHLMAKELKREREINTQDTDGSLWDNLSQPDSQDITDYQTYKRIRSER